MSSASRTLALGWTDIERDARRLAEKLSGKEPWEGMVAITRGGMVPALLIARALDIRVIDTLGLASYEGRVPGDVEILKAPERAAVSDGRNWLVIDDLVDTGGTIAMVRRLLSRAHVAAIYAKPAGRSAVDTYLEEVAQDTWIVFPWEGDEV